MFGRGKGLCMRGGNDRGLCTLLCVGKKGETTIPQFGITGANYSLECKKCCFRVMPILQRPRRSPKQFPTTKQPSPRRCDEKSPDPNRRLRPVRWGWPVLGLVEEGCWWEEKPQPCCWPHHMVTNREDNQQRSWSVGFSPCQKGSRTLRRSRFGKSDRARVR